MQQRRGHAIDRAVERRWQRSEGAAQLEERRGLAGRGAQLATVPTAHGADACGVGGRVEACGAVRSGGRGDDGSGSPRTE